ncbi:GATA transcription factor 5-like [Macadamia integrifolia]|uniref:GATA transcription factor 5-like n=1 Tax=Macadamia integrifolia TaxID=60698 RepID=UPI001C4EC024|nr:GATA transcription factor 5-like [Macadamia integrifolia]
MLYQTTALCSSFNPSSTTSSSSSSVSVTATSCPLPPHFPFCPLPSQAQIKPEMDCVVAKALKGSFRPEMGFMKSSPQAFLDEPWVGNVPTVVPGDDLFVDDLLDFPNDDVEEGLSQGLEGEKPCPSVSSSQGEQTFHDNSNSASFSFSELTVPADDLADLEWLSHFVEDSFLEFSVPNPSSTSSPTNKTQNGIHKLPEPEAVKGASVKPPSFCFPTFVPCKARSKRSRTGGRTWSLGSLSFTESSCTSSSSTTTTTSSSSSSTSLLTFSESGHNVDFLYYLGKPPAKKQKKKRKLVAEATGSQHHHQQQPQAPRRCSHCLVQKTPQWRTGPLGAKTLCNACGVRYKSGRLLPEYRPACSPTFSGDIHSNSHRKVLEMRRKKESDFAGIPLSLAPAVQSC